MPAFGMSDADIAAMSAFLDGMDRPEIGRGQLRLGSAEDGGLQGSFERAVTEGLADADPRSSAGFELVRARVCAACHFPFQTSPVGAPDMSTVAERLSADSLARVLTNGRPERGMPPPIPPLTTAELEAVTAYLGFLTDRRAALQERTRGLSGERRLDWRRLPWWEFP
jgi:mono/diheme cytochrome c family protein